MFLNRSMQCRCIFEMSLGASYIHKYNHPIICSKFVAYLIEFINIFYIQQKLIYIYNDIMQYIRYYLKCFFFKSFKNQQKKIAPLRLVLDHGVKKPWYISWY